MLVLIRERRDYASSGGIDEDPRRVRNQPSLDRGQVDAFADSFLRAAEARLGGSVAAQWSSLSESATVSAETNSMPAATVDALFVLCRIQMIAAQIAIAAQTTVRA